MTSDYKNIQNWCAVREKICRQFEEGESFTIDPQLQAKITALLAI